MLLQHHLWQRHFHTNDTMVMTRCAWNPLAQAVQKQNNNKQTNNKTTTTTKNNTRDYPWSGNGSVLPKVICNTEKPKYCALLTHTYASRVYHVKEHLKHSILLLHCLWHVLCVTYLLECLVWVLLFFFFTGVTIRHCTHILLKRLWLVSREEKNNDILLPVTVWRTAWKGCQ